MNNVETDHSRAFIIAYRLTKINARRIPRSGGFMWKKNEFKTAGKMLFSILCIAIISAGIISVILAKYGKYLSR